MLLEIIICAAVLVVVVWIALCSSSGRAGEAAERQVEELRKLNELKSRREVRTAPKIGAIKISKIKMVVADIKARREEMKHTPGKWVAFECSLYDVQLDSPSTVTDIPHSWIVQSASHLFVACCGQHKDTIANAHLIAAAPEMLEALEETVKWYGRRYGGNDELWPANMQPTEIAPCMAAIAKAKGEST